MQSSVVISGSGSGERFIAANPIFDTSVVNKINDCFPILVLQ